MLNNSFKNRVVRVKLFTDFKQIEYYGKKWKHNLEKRDAYSNNISQFFKDKGKVGEKVGELIMKADKIKYGNMEPVQFYQEKMKKYIKLISNT